MRASHKHAPGSGGSETAPSSRRFHPRTSLFVVLTVLFVCSPWLGHRTGIVLAAEPDEKQKAQEQEPAKKKPAAGPGQKLKPIPLGEKLVYRGQVSKAGLWLTAGTATFTSFRAPSGDVIVKAEAKGKKFGYTLDTTLVSRFRAGSDQPYLHTYVQAGSENRRKKLVFDGPKIAYWRYKHCRVPDCTDRSHTIRKIRWVGVIPWGRERKHCGDKDCGTDAHNVWTLRRSHVTEAPHVDFLTAVYRARQYDFTKGAKPVIIPVVSDHDRWNIEVTVVSEETIETEAGEFEAVRLALTPKGAEGTEVKKEFKGLFGLNGAIQVWVDRETHRPIRVQGDLPFAFLNLKATVELIEIGEVESAQVSPPAGIVEPASAKQRGATTKPLVKPKKAPG